MRISFNGADEVRAIIVDVLRRLPAPHRHYAVENITWREVGLNAKLYICHSPTKRRALPGDGAHEVMINGCVPASDLRGLICHETGHGWHRVVCDGELDWSGGECERLADRIRRGEVTRERWVRDWVTHELLADQMAELWGMPRIEAPGEERLRLVFEYEWDDAARLAARLDAQAGAHDCAAAIAQDET